MDKLENFINRLTDEDWGWWPVLFLRPPKDKEMDNPVLLKLTLSYGSAVGILFWLVLVIGAVEPLASGDIIVFFVFSMLLGWFLFFVVYKMTFAYFWNRRARRLRDQEPYT